MSLATLSALAILAQTPSEIRFPTQARFTIAGEARRIEMWLPEWERVTGLKLYADPQVREDVVYLSFKDRDASDALRKVAEILNAKWEPERNGFVLNRSRERIAAEVRAQQARDLESLRRNLAKSRETLAKKPDFTAEDARTLVRDTNNLISRFQPNSRTSNQWRTIQALESRAPMGRMIERIKARITAEDLIALRPEYQAVFTDNPTAAQYPLPAWMREVAQAYVREQRIWADAAKTANLANPSRGNMTWYVGSHVSNQGAVEGELGRVFLMITPSEDSRNYFVQLRLLTRGGKPLTQGYANITVGSEVAFLLGEEEIKPDPKEKPLDVGPLLERVLPTGPNRARSRRDPLPADLRTKLLQPTTYEPHDLMFGPVLRGMREQVWKRDIVAYLSHSLTSLYFFGNEPKPSYINRLLPVLFDFRQTDDTVMIRPQRPEHMRERRIPRSRQQEVTQLLLAKTFLTAEETARVAASVPFGGTDFFFLMIINQLSGRDQEWNMPAYDRLVRAYGHLSADDQKRALRPEGIPFKSLPPLAQQEILLHTFGMNGHLQYQPKEHDPNFDWDAWYNGMQGHPTQLFANGFPPTTVLQVTELNQDTVLVPEQVTTATDEFDWSSRAQTHGPRELADQIFYASRKDLFPWATKLNHRAMRYKLARQRVLNIWVKFTPEISQIGAITEQEIRSSDWIRFSDLPAPIRKTIDERLAELAQQYKDVKPGQFGRSTTGGGNAPPP